jgi:hypothetical protein
MPAPYLVYSTGFDPNSGGVIFMHNLVHVLNQMGQTAQLWPMKPFKKRGLRRRIKAALNPRPYAVDPALNTPVARPGDLTPDSIVVYPELVPGNPLGARNVVRWLLYKPGARHPYQFGPDEMFFRVGEFTDLPEITGGAPDLLMWRVNRTYRNENRPDRKGVCYIVRKGNKKARVPQTESADAICVDGMSHAEMNAVFNRCDTFISYDEATMYSQYAAICGCTSIVIPGFYSSRAAWSADHNLARYGVAYGFDDLDHARTTRDKVLPLLEAEEHKSEDTVRHFIDLTQARFAK